MIDRKVERVVPTRFNFCPHSASKRMGTTRSTLKTKKPSDHSEGYPFFDAMYVTVEPLPKT
jgi:hypothetical protein